MVDHEQFISMRVTLISRLSLVPSALVSAWEYKQSRVELTTWLISRLPETRTDLKIACYLRNKVFLLDPLSYPSSSLGINYFDNKIFNASPIISEISNIIKKKSFLLWYSFLIISSYAWNEQKTNFQTKATFLSVPWRGFWMKIYRLLGLLPDRLVP